jgi:hypothetical protein
MEKGLRVLGVSTTNATKFIYPDTSLKLIWQRVVNNLPD